VPNVHAAIQAMRGATVAEGVRVYASDAGAFRRCDDHPVNAFLSERLIVRFSLGQFAAEIFVQHDTGALSVWYVVVSELNRSHDALAAVVGLAPLAGPDIPALIKPNAAALTVWVL